MKLWVYPLVVALLLSSSIHAMEQKPKKNGRVHKCNVNPKNKDQDTPLHIAAAKGGYKIMSLLLKAGAEVDAKNKDGHTPLHWAADAGRSACINLLVEHSANINEVIPSIEHTPLHCAACQGHLSTVKQLVVLGADKTMRTKKGETACDLAKMYGFQEIVDYLNAHEVDTTDCGMDDSTVEDKHFDELLISDDALLEYLQTVGKLLDDDNEA